MYTIMTSIFARALELALQLRRACSKKALHEMSQLAIPILLAVSFLCCKLSVGQQRVVSLEEAHALAIKEPGEKASPDTGPFSGMTHTAWTRNDGAPESISSLAQTTEGYLWIGSSLGLYRFDGVRFAAYPFSADQVPLPTQDVSSIAADPAGGLWIGLRMTAVVHILPDGSALVYGRSSGLTSDTLERVTVRKDGSVWVLAGGNLLTLQSEQWNNFGQAHGLGQGRVFSFLFDDDGTIWVAQDHRLMALRKNTNIFKKVPASVFFVSAMAETRKGQIWMADAWRTVRQVTQTSRSAPIRLHGKAELLADRYDHLWIAEDYFGLTRLRDSSSDTEKNPLIEHASSNQWLTSPQIGGMFEDRDGNIWVGTALGLDRYQPTSFQQFISAPLNFYPSVIGARDGSVWINSHGESLMRWHEGKLTTFGAFVTYGPLATRRNGEVCFVDARASELQCFGSRHATYVLLDKRIEYAPALAMIEDTDGSLLVSFENKGVWRYHGSWDRVYSSLAPSDAPLSMFLDSSSRLWMGFEGNQIAVRSGERFQILSMPGPWTNTLALYEGAGVVWAAGSSGLGFFDRGRLHRVHSNTDHIFDGTSGIAFDRMGNLWLNSGAGALRVAASSVANLLHTGDSLTGVEVFNERDGVIGKPTQFKPTPSLVTDANGRLWFATAGHLVMADPQTFVESTNRFSVLVESLSLDGRLLLPQGQHPQAFKAEAADRHSLEVSFAALNLSQPERMTYRYRLLGEDTDWQDAGSRRQAFYTRLRPGKYTFQVSAREEQGPWIDLLVPLQIEALPAFYQTAWFDVIAVLSSALLIFAAYVIRLRQATRRISLLSEERTRERVRIARELHDTLLQGVQGLTLHFHVAAQELPRGSHARESMEKALTTADRILVEGRDSVTRLRAHHLTASGLAAVFEAIAAELDHEKRVRFIAKSEGRADDVIPSVLHELYSIGREAITNAFRHSHASEITVDLKCTPKSVELVVADNGDGFDSAEQEANPSAGHWGLCGMKERAEVIGARFNCHSTENRGTQVIVTVPGGLAYRKRSARGKS